MMTYERTFTNIYYAEALIDNLVNRGREYNVSFKDGLVIVRWN